MNINKSSNLYVNDDGLTREVKEQATSVRQTSEWAITSFQGSFPRVKDRTKYEHHGEIKLIIKMLILLYN